MNHKPSSFLCIGNGWFPHTPGGLERYVYELTNHLTSCGDFVHLCGVGLPKVGEKQLLKTTNLASINKLLWQRLWSTYNHFSSENLTQFDAINLHFALYSLPILPYLPPKIPVTFTFHGSWALESQQEGSNPIAVGLKKYLEQQVYQRCDRFIVLSKAFGKILHQHYQIPWDKIYLIPGGVDTQKFKPNLSRYQARDKLNWPSDRFILFTPRRLVQRMGLGTLLHAIAKIKPQFPDIWLAIAGQGPLKIVLEQQVQELGLNNQVKFLGFLPDHQLPIAYQGADLTVMPSQSLEGFGLVLLESLACGTPIMATPVGGMPEILTPLCPELISNSTTVEAITEKLLAVLKGNISMPSQVTCRDYTVQNFSWPSIAQQIRQVLLI